MKNINIPYTLRRSKRKSLSIQIKHGQVFVLAPYRYPVAQIEQFMRDKSSWIQQHLQNSQAKQALKDQFTLAYGDTIPYRGQRVTLVATDKPATHHNHPPVYTPDTNCLHLPQNLDSDQIKAACIHWYKQQAKAHTTARTAHYTPLMGQSPASLKVSSAKTRWGSCSSRRTVTFSWRLMMASDSAIDYVVVHELAHLWEMNHSAKFWAHVARVMPDYEQRMAQLRATERQLSEQNWE